MKAACGNGFFEGKPGEGRPIVMAIKAYRYLLVTARRNRMVSAQFTYDFYVITRRRVSMVTFFQSKSRKKRLFARLPAVFVPLTSVKGESI